MSKSKDKANRKAKKNVKQNVKKNVKRKSIVRATKTTDNPYRPKSGYGLIFEEGSRGFQLEKDLIKRVAKMIGKTEAVVQYSLDVLKRSNSKSNNGKSTALYDDQGQIKLVALERTEKSVKVKATKVKATKVKAKVGPPPVKAKVEKVTVKKAKAVKKPLVTKADVGTPVIASVICATADTADTADMADTADTADTEPASVLEVISEATPETQPA